MLNLATVIAFAVFTFGAVPIMPANAAPAPITETAPQTVAADIAADIAAPDEEATQVAYYCEYVIVWDAWGNAYYEYLCY